MQLVAGTVTALVGPNGAGKTTLLKVLAGLQRPTTGEVRVWGRPIPRRFDPTLLSTMSYLSQERALYRSLRVSDILRLGAAMNPGWNAEYAFDRTSRHQLPLHQRVSTLSGGQRTQLALTLTLAKDPRLLLLDEPLSDLDPVARQDVLAELMTMVADKGATIVLSSHVVGELATICDNLIVLRNGRVVLSGRIDEVIDEHRVLIGPADQVDCLSLFGRAIDFQNSSRQVAVLIQLLEAPDFLDRRWQSRSVDLNSIVTGYLRGRNFSTADKDRDEGCAPWSA